MTDTTKMNLILRETCNGEIFIFMKPLQIQVDCWGVKVRDWAELPASIPMPMPSDLGRLSDVNRGFLRHHNHDCCRHMQTHC